MTIIDNMDDILKAKSGMRKTNENQSNLFGDSGRGIKLKLAESKPASKTQKLNWEKELLGLFVTDHPLKDFSSTEEAKKFITISQALSLPEGRNIKTYGLISKIQSFQTKKGDQMLFAKIEDLSDTIEVLVFSTVLKENQSIWTEGNTIKIAGRISKKNGEPKLICNQVARLRPAIQY